jgi:[protein-PII] uridylyltransferase
LWRPGWSVLAVGGTGRHQLCPGSDIDLLLIHPKKTPESEIRQVSEALLYPLWDVGLKITPATHSQSSALELANREVISAVTWLDGIHLAGNVDVSQQLIHAALHQWQLRSQRYLPKLLQLTYERHAKHGEVAFLLEPELRDGRGGLRDMHVLSFVERSNHPAIGGIMERPLAEMAICHDMILTARAELHRRTGRPSDRLLLQEQDGVAEGLGYESADALMSAVSAAARTIAWSTEESLRRLSNTLNKKFASRFGKPMKVGPNIAVQSGELVLTDDSDTQNDVTLLLRAAATAALNQTSLSRETLRQFAEHSPEMPNPWPEKARNALVALLGAGKDMLSVMEALDQYDLISRILPEWASVRAKPQRNAYHRFTVDRHLCEAAANAAELVRRVGRPDLLLIGAWLHDLGKGYVGDHTEVGVELMMTIGPRMGFPPADVGVLIDLVRHHLLIPDASTRRDLSDIGTISFVANAVGDVDRLQLLRTLTEADSLATGPTAWSEWKAQLCDELVMRTEAVLEGRRPPEPTSPIGPHNHDLLLAARLSGSIVISPSTDSSDAITIAAIDRPGLFSAIAGSLSMHGVDVVSADVWTTDDGLAIDMLHVSRRVGGETDWRRVERTMNAALDGSLDLSEELRHRDASYVNSAMARHARHLAAQPAVFVSDELQERATVIEVRAPDGLAVLYRVARTLTRLGLDIRTAKVTTLGHEVVDAFSVVRVEKDGSFSKVGQGKFVETIREAILEDLTRNSRSETS